MFLPALDLCASLQASFIVWCATNHLRILEFKITLLVYPFVRLSKYFHMASKSFHPQMKNVVHKLCFDWFYFVHHVHWLCQAHMYTWSGFMYMLLWADFRNTSTTFLKKTTNSIAPDLFSRTQLSRTFHSNYEKCACSLAEGSFQSGSNLIITILKGGVKQRNVILWCNFVGCLNFGEGAAAGFG